MPQRIIKKIKKIGEKLPKKVAKIKKVTTKKTKPLIAKEYLPLKRILEKKEKRLKKQLSNVASKRKSVKGDYKARFPFFGHGKDEDAQEVTQYEKRISIEHQLEVELEKVESAIEKIKEGKYGTCKNCKKKIQPERLKIYPEAQHCMECHKKDIS